MDIATFKKFAEEMGIKSMREVSVSTSVSDNDIITPEQTQVVMDLLAVKHAEEWQRCYPRVYKGKTYGDFYSPKRPSHQMLGVAAKVDEAIFGDNEEIEITWASLLAQHRVPLYFITRDILEAVTHTTPPFAIDWLNMKMPYGALVFMLPKGFLKVSEIEGDCTFLSYARVRKDVPMKSLATQGPHTWIPDHDGFMVLAETQRGCLMHWNMPHKDMPIVDLKKPSEIVGWMAEDKYQHRSGGRAAPFSYELTTDDQTFMARAVHYVFGLILLINSRPQLVTRGQLLSKPSTEHIVRREVWSPYVVGANYKIRHEVKAVQSSDSHHASPRFHWVRGFYREQACGAGMKDHKTLWIEPFTRGVKDEA